MLNGDTINCAVQNINEDVGPGSKLVISDTIGSAGEFSAVVPKNFLSYERDSTFSVAGIREYYFGARMYDAEVGSWFSTDPVFNNGKVGVSKSSQFWNTYSYVGGNTVNVIDSNGQWAVTMHDDVSDWLEARVDVHNAYANTFRDYYESSSDMPKWAQWAEAAHRYNNEAAYNKVLEDPDIPIGYKRHLISDAYSMQGFKNDEMYLTVTQRLLKWCASSGEKGENMVSTYQDVDLDIFFNPLGRNKQIHELRRHQAYELYNAGVIDEKQRDEEIKSANTRRGWYVAATIADPGTTHIATIAVSIIKVIVGWFK